MVTRKGNEHPSYAHHKGRIMRTFDLIIDDVRFLQIVVDFVDLVFAPRPPIG